jgi:hypothetical protein
MVVAVAAVVVAMGEAETWVLGRRLGSDGPREPRRVAGVCSRDKVWPPIG